jgi:hypothetical protein
MPRHPTKFAWFGLALLMIFGFAYAINLARF